MKNFAILFCTIFTILSSLTAQNQPNQQSPQPNYNNSGTTGNSNAQNIAVGNAIQKFKASDFMVHFGDFKTQMEADAREFITRQNMFSVKDVRRVQVAYDKTSAKFNQIMLDIKQDFMDKEKIKMVNKFPDMYSNGLKGKMDNLEEFYKANFQQTLADVTEKDGSALLLLLIDLVKSVSELSSQFKMMKFEKQYMTDQYIEQNLVAPYKLPTWTELGSNVTIRTDVARHSSRDGYGNGGNTNNGNSGNGGYNNGNNGNNGGNGNGNTNNGNNGGGYGNDNTNNGGNQNGGNGNGNNGNNGGNGNDNTNNGGNQNGGYGNGNNGNNGNNGGGYGNGNTNNGGKQNGSYNNGGIIPNHNVQNQNDSVQNPPTEFGVEGQSSQLPVNVIKRGTPTAPNTEEGSRMNKMNNPNKKPNTPNNAPNNAPKPNGNGNNGRQ